MIICSSKALLTYISIFSIWAKAVVVFMLACGCRDGKPQAFRRWLSVIMNKFTLCKLLSANRRLPDVILKCIHIWYEFILFNFL